jgi:hypothetical protein
VTLFAGRHNSIRDRSILACVLPLLARTSPGVFLPGSGSTRPGSGSIRGFVKILSAFE